jgi:hypothetical protein
VAAAAEQKTPRRGSAAAIPQDEWDRRVRQVHRLRERGLSLEEIRPRFEYSLGMLTKMSRAPHPDTGKCGWWAA